MKLQGKVAIITGAGRGLGKAISKAFAHEGAWLVLGARTLQEVEATAAALHSAGVVALPVQVDVSDPGQVDKLVASAMREFGQVDILVNNAGVYPPFGPLMTNDPEAWLYTLKVNLYGTFLCCRAVLPHMMERRWGRIINLSGGGATSSLPNFTAYACSKTGVVRLTEILADEVKPYNIQVNSIAPGPLNTRMTEQVLEAGEIVGETMLARAQQIKDSGGAPLEQAAELAVFLASEESRGLSGLLLSAVWDDWKRLPEQIDTMVQKDWYTLRRLTPP